MTSTQTYDFIIVGGGTAGCLLAHRLSHSAAAPSVLLLEAGTKPSGAYLSAPGHRFATFTRPELDYGYTSEPEPALNGRQIPYARGKGLGGSSILNFGVYLYGSSEDYNRWAELVGDDAWAWESVKESFRTIENYETEGVQTYQRIAQPAPAQHGTNGRLVVGLPPVLEKGIEPQMEALISAGEKVCLDPNSGNPIGISVFPYSFGKKGRSTSAIAHLVDPPKNLEVWTDATVKELVFEGDRVVGVDCVDGRKATASKEVILCCGSIDTPKLLLLNGIGPNSELERLGIEVKKDLPSIGKHLKDHIRAFMCVEVDGSVNDRNTFETGSAEVIKEAEEMWDRDQTGALALHDSGLWGGFLKMPGLEEMQEFQHLHQSEQAFLSREGVPHFEFIGNTLGTGAQITPGNAYMAFCGILMNPQSNGSVTLRSRNAEDKPILRFNFLTHPYDIAVMRNSVRNAWKLMMENPDIAPHVRKTILAPSSLSDTDIDAYCKEQVGPVWHANGTVRMGKEEEGGSVDSDGRVHGVQGLRVADLSVCPLTPNNHTQATAYLIGQKISEKMIEEYGLDR